MRHGSSRFSKHAGRRTDSATCSRSTSGARGRRGFLVVGVLGFIPGITTHYDMLTFAGHHSEAPTNFVPVNTADNWLHFALAVGMLALGVLLGWTVDAPNLAARH